MRYSCHLKKMLIENTTSASWLQLKDVETHRTTSIYFLSNIASWWDVRPPQVASFEEWKVWIAILNLSSNRKLVLEGVIYTAWWTIWNFRNKLVFGSTTPSKAVLFDDIVARSFQWCKHRGRFNFNWIDWLKNPYLVTM